MMVWKMGIRGTAFLLVASGMAICQQQPRRSLHSPKPLPDAPLAQTFAASFSSNNISSSSQASRSATLIPHFGGPEEILRLQSASIFRGAAVSVFRENFTSNSDDIVDGLLRWVMTSRSSMRPEVLNGSLVERAGYAASRTLISRTPEGKGRLNTQYILGVLSSAVLHTAYRPYWRRPVSAPFGDFGSTVGNDAGMNLLHEFTPDLEQLMKNHTPRFVSRIEQTIRGK
jgi:hypothetical protein